MNAMQVLIASPRKEFRKSTLSSLRGSGKIPAVVYGKTISNTPIYVEEKEFTQFEKDHGLHSILKLMWGEDNSAVFVGEVQRDPLKNQVIHIDFQEANMNKKMNIEIPVEWIGEEEFEKQGLILQRPHFALEVSCLPANMPDKIKVDVRSLGVGDSLTVGDIHLGDGVEMQLSEDTVIVSVLAPTLQTDPEEPQIEEESEPEIVDAVDGPGIDAAK